MCSAELAACLERLGLRVHENDAQLLGESPLGKLLVGLCQRHSGGLGPQTAAGLAELQRSLVAQQEQLAALKAESMELVGRTATCSAYSGRLERLRLLFDQYGQELEQLVTRLGLGGAAPEQAGDRAAMQAYLQSNQSALRNALQLGSIDPAALLEPSEPCPSALTAGAVLPVVQAGLAEDTATVQALTELGRPGEQQQQQPAQPPLEQLLDALRQCHWQQHTEAEAAQQRRSEAQRQLHEEVQAAATREADGGGPPGPDPGLEHLAAQRAGLAAALQLLEQLGQELVDEQRVAAQQEGEASAALGKLVQLEAVEEELDRSIRNLCAADRAFMRRWREGTWQAQAFIADGLLAAQQPLQQLITQLEEAMGQELAAFRSMCWPGQAAAAQSPAAANTIEAAAQRLDPVAHLKTREHCAKVLAAAAEEVQELRPVHATWGALVASNGQQLQQLQETAASLQKEVAQLNTATAEGIHDHLDKACAAAEEGMAAVQSVRRALADWWTLPALKAVPWMKYEGRTATEWLQVLAESQELLVQRDVFKDHSNRRGGMR